MEGSKKRWPLGLIKRGVRMASTVPDVIWWQEPEPEGGKQEVRITTVEAAQSIGYEAHYFVPIGYSQKLVEAAEELLACIPGDAIQYADTEEAVQQLEMVIQSYRDNVSDTEVVNG